MPYKDKEKKKEYNKHYRETHKEKKAMWDKHYRDTHKEKIATYDKHYNNIHKEEIKKKKHEYYLKNREKALNYQHEYYLENRGKGIKDSKYWRENNPKKAKEIDRKHKSKRERNLGFNPLNEWFKNSEAHHINFNDIIYIPKELHQSIAHNIWTGKNIALINSLAYQFLFGNYIIYE